MVAQALLEKLLLATGEPMPHLAYNGTNGTDCIEYKLPSSLTRMAIYGEISTAMTLEGLAPISKSTFYTIWADQFANYKLHTLSAFSKCDKCIRLKEALQYERKTRTEGLGR